jgi:hypothetical protein
MSLLRLKALTQLKTADSFVVTPAPLVTKWAN